MIKVKVEEQDYEKVLKECWENDEKLLKKWHISSGKGLDEVLKNTMETLTEDTDKTTFNFYKIKDGNNIIGFFGHEIYMKEPFLTTFGVKPEFRSDDIKDKFFKVITNTIGNDFATFLYSKNTPAIHWLIKKGAVLKESLVVEGEEVVRLTFKN
tara:strand:- start:11136 stop:11597 length:462 start_codon:yes stop_codon:yes gene_type:complete